MLNLHFPYPESTETSLCSDGDKVEIKQSVGTDLATADLFHEPELVQADIKERIPLLPLLQLNGLTYSLVCRGLKACFYRQVQDGEVIGYIVSLIYKHKSKAIKGKSETTLERWVMCQRSKNNSYRYLTIENALEKYEKLENKSL